MPGVCRGYAGGMPGVCRGYAGGMPRVCRGYVRGAKVLFLCHNLAKPWRKPGNTPPKHRLRVISAGGKEKGIQGHMFRIQGDAYFQ